MKTATATVACCLSSALCIVPALGNNEGQLHGDPYSPVGTLHVDKTWVQTGVRPRLSWNIEYPQFVDDVVDINPDDSIDPRKRTRMEIRAVGAAFQIGATHTPLSLQCRLGSGNSWEPLFVGTDSQVNPAQVLTSRVVDPGTRIDFAARAQRLDGSWYSSRDTQTSNDTVIALKNGDPVPNFVPAYQQGTVSSFLSQYISSDNKITIGPRDVIYLYELYATSPSSSVYDMQDMVVVVTFKDAD